MNREGLKGSEAPRAAARGLWAEQPGGSWKARPGVLTQSSASSPRHVPTDGRLGACPPGVGSVHHAVDAAPCTLRQQSLRWSIWRAGGRAVPPEDVRVPRGPAAVSVASRDTRHSCFK